MDLAPQNWYMFKNIKLRCNNVLTKIVINLAFYEAPSTFYCCTWNVLLSSTAFFSVKLLETFSKEVRRSVSDPVFLVDKHITPSIKCVPWLVQRSRSIKTNISFVGVIFREALEEATCYYRPGEHWTPTLSRLSQRNVRYFSISVLRVMVLNSLSIDSLIWSKSIRRVINFIRKRICNRVY